MIGCGPQDFSEFFKISDKEIAVAADMKVMRVDQRNLAGAAETGRSQETQAIGRDGRPVSLTNQVGSGNDRVELSALSRALNAGAWSRQARIDQLTAQYQTGQYQPDPAAISKSMLDEALSGCRM